MAWLAFGTQTRRLADGETIVGSGSDADWRVPTADLMPRHFVVTVHGLNASIRSYSTDIIVVVNGEQLGRSYHLLNDGDAILAGRGRFVYSDDTPVTQELPPEDAVDDAYLVEERQRLAHSLARRSTTIGRDVSNTIVLKDPRASRFHAEIRREAGGFALHSMGAAGTARNGATMTGPALLQDDDTIEIAFTTFRFTRGPLSDAITIAPLSSELNDAAARLPTSVGQRVTVESSTRDTVPPAAVFATVVGLLVIGGLVVALAWAAWVTWGQ
jgi:pSer/pThr/pTyr-binding forkhead associated (FHA) protein